MKNSILRLWNSISLLGCEVGDEISINERRQKIFFNRAVVIGFFLLLVEIVIDQYFVDGYDYFFLINNGIILVALYLHSKGLYDVAKRIVVYSFFIVGIGLMSMYHKGTLFHLGAFTLMCFALIVFSKKSERFDLFLCFILTLIAILIGEFNVFNAPNYDYSEFAIARLINVLGYIVVISIFIFFMIDMNKDFEGKLSMTLSEGVMLEKMLTDRSEKLTAQQLALDKQNREKEVLLKEIHHRVKNNLQIITGLIKIQSQKFSEDKVLKALKETQSRVDSMALVHKKMYQAQNFDEIELASYIKHLVHNIEKLFNNLENDIQLSISTPFKLKLDLETAIPLGLIMNELISNAFKYAFVPPLKNAALSIEIKDLGNGFYSLTCADNGPGFSPGFTIDESESIGLTLSTTLTEQIGGEFDFYNDNGAVFNLTFQKNSQKYA